MGPEAAPVRADTAPTRQARIKFCGAVAGPLAPFL